MDGLLRADFFATATVDAADHVDLEELGMLLGLGPLIIAWNFFGMDCNGLGKTDEFAELAGHTVFAILLVCHQGRSASVALGEVVIQLLLGTLHHHLSLPKEGLEEVTQRV